LKDGSLNCIIFFLFTVDIGKACNMKVSEIYRCLKCGSPNFVYLIFHNFISMSLLYLLWEIMGLVDFSRWSDNCTVSWYNFVSVFFFFQGLTWVVFLNKVIIVFDLEAYPFALLISVGFISLENGYAVVFVFWNLLFHWHKYFIFP
jgi:hypothetical protein